MRPLAVAVVVVFCLAGSSLPFQPLPSFQPLFAQGGNRGASDPTARRVNERVRTLQAEADKLAAQSRTLLGDLRQLEIRRDIAAEQVKSADAAVTSAQAALQQATERLHTLETQRESQLPDLEVRLVDIYKRGRGGYARMLFDVRGLREFARAMRAVSSLTTINEQKIAAHRRTLMELRQQRDAMQQHARELEAAAKEAERARTEAQRAVAAREALIAEIDRRRDLNAQLAGELDVAYQRLREQLANAAAGRPVEPVSLPLASFRGALEWPAAGRFTRSRNGIEIAAAEGTPARAVHPGTVDYADTFTGFGNLVILDHGGNYYSLYGYLGSIAVSRGQLVDAGTELGLVGTAPAGPSALYFELRVDGRSVDPIQWLKPR